MQTQKSADGTIKLTYSEGYHSVIIPVKDKNALCVSCQIGCSVGCKICHTGKLGFTRNLSAEEIINQFERARSLVGKIDTVVFMGMGEPTLNLQAVLKSAEYFHRFLSYNHITISTSCPNKKALNELIDLPYAIAVSLHSPFDSERKKLANSSVKVREIVAFARKCSESRNKRTILVEYALINGVNDSVKDLKKLVSFKWPERTMFNIIEFNQIGKFMPAEKEKFDFFKEGVIKAGWKCFNRQARGRDIGAACGMLS